LPRSHAAGERQVQTRSSRDILDVAQSQQIFDPEKKTAVDAMVRAGRSPFGPAIPECFLSNVE
jgi:hypothetical protein